MDLQGTLENIEDFFIEFLDNHLRLVIYILIAINIAIIVFSLVLLGFAINFYVYHHPIPLILVPYYNNTTYYILAFIWFFIFLAVRGIQRYVGLRQ